MGDFHLTGGAPAQAQFAEIVDYVNGEERVVIAGDVNLRPPYAQIDGKGFSEPLARQHRPDPRARPAFVAAGAPGRPSAAASTAGWSPTMHRWSSTIR